MTRAAAVALYAGLAVPMAIISHVAAEALALHESVLSVATSPIHFYLAILAAVSLLIASLAAIGSRRDLQRLGGLMAQALPFKGQGVRFFAMSAVIQFGFAAGTLLGEGSLSAASAFVALVAVAVASILASAGLALLRERLQHVACSQHRVRCERTGQVSRVCAHLSFGPYFAYVPVRGNRPPPLL